MKTMNVKKSPITILALAAVVAVGVMVLFHGCGKPTTYSAPADNTSTVSSTGTSTVTTTGTLVSIALSRPIDASLTDDLPKGKTAYYVAKGTYSDGTVTDITQTVTWTSSNTSVAMVGSYVANKGMGIKAMAIGTTTITATLGSVSQSSPLNVTASTGY